MKRPINPERLRFHGYMVMALSFAGAVVMLWRPSLGLPLPQNTAEWMALLESLNVRYFALWSPTWYPEDGKLERESIAALPGRFLPAGKWQSSDFGQIELYEIARPPLLPQAPAAQR